MAAKPYVVALEEHYHDQEVRKAAGEHILKPDNYVGARIHDLGELRIKDMDEAGIDFQILSQGASSTQRMDPETAVKMARGANDRLHEAVRAHPTRFGAFAALPTPDPKAAADELERVVTKYGFKGAMIHGLTNGAFLDEQRFWPIFERARALDVPLYLHPAEPHPTMVDLYLKDYAEKWPNILGSAWGFTIETATQAIRLVLSGAFEAYPGLKIILGHLGEGLPFYLWRINQSLSRRGPASSKSFRDTFCEHFYVTTSGFFSDAALQCSITELGLERVLFSVDYPFVANTLGTDWMNQIAMNAEDKAKLFGGNAKKLLKL